MGNALKVLVSGAMVMGYLTAGLYFLRFWRDTRDRLFAIFAAAFGLLAVQRAALTLAVHGGEQGSAWIYGIRLLAFLLILFAIVDKNRAG
jgi:amino acid transporter